MLIRDVERASLQAFDLKKACGRPGFCRATLRLPEDQCRQWLSRPGQILAVSSDAPDGTPLFFGTIESVAIKKPALGPLVEICAKSCAISEKEVLHRRVFQKQGKKFGDILDAGRLKMKDCDLEIDPGLKSLACEPIIFQNQSNFDFIRRLAHATGRKFWVLDDIEGKPSLAAKFCLDKSAKKFAEEKLFSLRNIKTIQGRKLEITSREYCPLGRLATVAQVEGKFLVTAMSLTLENECDIYAYTLEEYTEKELPFDGFQENAPLLPGRIGDVADPDKKGRVRFAVDPAFAEDEDEDKVWLAWVTPYAGTKAGMVFVPEKDDPAQMILSAGRGVVQGAVRENTLAEEAQDVANKYLGNNFGERIIWKEDSLELRSGENYLILTPKDITIKLEDVSISLDKENMRARLGGEIEMNGRKISFNLKENAEINAKNVRIEGSDAAKVNAKSVQIAGSDAVKMDARDITIRATGTAKIGGKVELG